VGISTTQPDGLPGNEQTHKGSPPPAVPLHETLYPLHTLLAPCPVVPPETETLIDPLFPPLHVTFVETALATNCVG
jgi:hypothetical protein